MSYDELQVSADEACRFACNAVVVDKTVVMNVDNPQTAALLDRRGYRTVFVNMSEFIKSGGSTMCCTLEI
jgi:N-dimethylarginine dimethylaminohydrolase